MKLKKALRELKKARVLNHKVLFLIIFLPLNIFSKYLIFSEEFKSFIVLSASTDEEKSRGLMFKKKLSNSNGMIFFYKKPKIVNFWMKNTFIPLEIIFINSEKRIISIKNGVPFSKTNISSDFPVIAVIEVPKNCSKKIGIKVGDKLSWSKIKYEEESKKYLPCIK